MVKETKLYDSLNIKPESTQDEIKKGYRYVNALELMRGNDAASSSR